MARLEFGRLGTAALVVPENGRPQYPALSILDDRGMRTGTERHSRDFVARKAGCEQYPPHGLASGTPPVVRILLAPEWLWRRSLQVTGGTGDHPAATVDDGRLEASGANVDAHQPDRAAAFSPRHGVPRRAVHPSRG